MIFHQTWMWLENLGFPLNEISFGYSQKMGKLQQFISRYDIYSLMLFRIWIQWRITYRTAYIAYLQFSTHSYQTVSSFSNITSNNKVVCWKLFLTLRIFLAKFHIKMSLYILVCTDKEKNETQARSFYSRKISFSLRDIKKWKVNLKRMMANSFFKIMNILFFSSL